MEQKTDVETLVSDSPSWSQRNVPVDGSKEQSTAPKNDFIKTTYDISLDSLISLFSRGFSPLWPGTQTMRSHKRLIADKNGRNERKEELKVVQNDVSAILWIIETGVPHRPAENRSIVSVSTLQELCWMKHRLNRSSLSKVVFQVVDHRRLVWDEILLPMTWISASTIHPLWHALSILAVTSQH